MITVFEGIPDRFVQIYDREFRYWAANYRRVGRVAAFRLRRPVEPLVVSRDPRRIIGVRLQADLDEGGLEPRMVIRPQTDADAEAIARHVVDMGEAVH